MNEPTVTLPILHREVDELIARRDAAAEREDWVSWRELDEAAEETRLWIQKLYYQ